MEIKHINHASLLLKNNQGNYLWIDPWVISPAFETWTQYPSPVAKSILDILNMPKDKISIVISHGHDDHIDEALLNKYFYDIDILIPKFPTLGFYKRIERAVGQNITEVDNTGIHHQGWHITNFIGTASPDGDDTLFTIEEGDTICIHANDNWQDYPEDLVKDLNNVIGKYKKHNRKYCVQLGIADAYPHSYINFDDDNCRQLMDDRVEKYSSAVQNNIQKLDVEGAFIYANQSAVNNQLQRNIDYENDIKHRIIDDCHLTKQLYPGAIVDNFENYDSNQQFQEYSDQENVFDYLLSLYYQDAMAYIQRKHTNPNQFKFEFVAVDSYSNLEPDESKTVYYATKNVWSNILIGKYHLESITVGGLGVINKPTKLNIAEGHHWLTKWAYKKQNMIKIKGVFGDINK